MPRQQQVIEFHPRHRAAVLDGSKTVTVRWNETINIGPARLTLDSTGRETAFGIVLEVQRVPLDDLSAAAVQAPRGTDMPEYVQQLRDNYYPSMPNNAILEVVHFRVQGTKHL